MYEWYKKLISISIHAPAGGATEYNENRGDEIYFNSRPCGRGDAYKDIERNGLYIISIHAPAGGAT